MPRKKGSGGVPLTATIPRESYSIFCGLAVDVTNERGRVVPEFELRSEAFIIGVAVMRRCAKCRAGTCSIHRLPRRARGPVEPSEAPTIISEVAIDLEENQPSLAPSIEVVVVAAPVQAVLPILPPAVPAEAPKRRGRPKNAEPSIKRACPEGFGLTDEMRAYAKSRDIGPDRVADVFDGFLIFHRAKGSKFADWTLAWYNWCRNDKSFSGQSKLAQSSARPSTMQREPMPEGW